MDEGLKEKISKMTTEEYEAFLKERELEHTASVGDFVKYLKENFKDSDKLCYIDCVEGCKYDATPMKLSDLGDKFFTTVDASKKYLIEERKFKKKEADDMYQYVNDSDIIVV